MILLMAALCLGQAAGSGMDASQFARVMSTYLAAIDDVSFVFEGTSGAVRRAQAGPSEAGKAFQGIYSFRRDGATYLDVITTLKTNGAMTERRDTRALIHNRLSTLSLTPGGRRDNVFVEPGIPGSLDRPTSPEQFCYMWYFYAMKDPASHRFEDRGWVEVDGHRCLYVRLHNIPSGASRGSSDPTTDLWIDLERGGHPLRIELRSGDGPKGLKRRVSDIRLAAINLDGTKVWLPVEGRIESFVTLKGNSENPLHEERIKILDGTILLNRGLPDASFDPKASGVIATAKLAQSREEFEKLAPRRDAKGIRDRLQVALIEADKQSKEVDASNPTASSRGLLTQLIVVSMGIASIAVAVILKRRG